MLMVKRLDERAILPTCEHPGHDLGFDIYALNDVDIPPNRIAKISTGISAQYVSFSFIGTRADQYGLFVKDRSSIAATGLFIVGGVIDASYRGEIFVLLRNATELTQHVKTGLKIAQLVPIEVCTACAIIDVSVLPRNGRDEKGFGSSGQ